MRSPGIFDADGKAEQAFCDAAGLSFFFGEVAVRLGSRIGNEAFHAAKAFSKADELDVLEVSSAVSWVSV